MVGKWTAGLTAVLAVAVALVGGCGKPADGPSEDPETGRRRVVLGEIYDMYTYHLKQNQKPPQKAADLATTGNQALYSTTVQGIKSEEYVVVWGTDLGGNDNAVLAYHKGVPKDGGPVLLCNGSIKQMSADEFKAAPKAGKM